MTAVVERQEAPTALPPPRRRRWPLRVVLGVGALLVGFAVAALVYLTNVEPLVDGGAEGVFGITGEVTEISPPMGETEYLLRFRPGDRFLIGFALQNSSLLPVRLDKIWPNHEFDHHCFWEPSDRRVRTGVNFYSTDAPSVPADGYTLQPGEKVLVELRGGFPPPSQCRGSISGIVSQNFVEIRTTITGVSRRHEFVLPYELGWSSDPQDKLKGLTQ